MNYLDHVYKSATMAESLRQRSTRSTRSVGGTSATSAASASSDISAGGGIISPASSTVSNRSFTVNTESEGSRIMSEDEVSSLVHNALQRARQATSSARSPRRMTPRNMGATSPREEKKFDEHPLSPNSATSQGRSDNIEVVESKTSGLSINRSTNDDGDGDGSVLSTTSSGNMDKLLAPSETISDGDIEVHVSVDESSVDGTSALGAPSFTSVNSSDAIIRRVEEEIANARKVKEVVERGANPRRSFGRPYKKNAVKTFLGAVDDDKFDEQEIHEMLSVSDGGATEFSYHSAMDMIGAEFAGSMASSSGEGNSLSIKNIEMEVTQTNDKYQASPSRRTLQTNLSEITMSTVPDGTDRSVISTDRYESEVVLSFENDDGLNVKSPHSGVHTLPIAEEGEDDSVESTAAQILSKEKQFFPIDESKERDVSSEASRHQHYPETLGMGDGVIDLTSFDSGILGAHLNDDQNTGKGGGEKKEEQATTTTTAKAGCDDNEAEENNVDGVIDLTNVGSMATMGSPRSIDSVSRGVQKKEYDMPTSPRMDETIANSHSAVGSTVAGDDIESEAPNDIPCSDDVLNASQDSDQNSDMILRESILDITNNSEVNDSMFSDSVLNITNATEASVNKSEELNGSVEPSSTLELEPNNLIKLPTKDLDSEKADDIATPPKILERTESANIELQAKDDKVVGEIAGSDLQTSKKPEDDNSEPIYEATPKKSMSHGGVAEEFDDINVSNEHLESLQPQSENNDTSAAVFISTPPEAVDTDPHAGYESAHSEDYDTAEEKSITDDAIETAQPIPIDVQEKYEGAKTFIKNIQRHDEVQPEPSQQTGEDQEATNNKGDKNIVQPSNDRTTDANVIPSDSSNQQDNMNIPTPQTSDTGHSEVAMNILEPWAVTSKSGGEVVSGSPQRRLMTDNVPTKECNAESDEAIDLVSQISHETTVCEEDEGSMAIEIAALYKTAEQKLGPPKSPKKEHMYERFAMDRGSSTPQDKQQQLDVDIALSSSPRNNSTIDFDEGVREAHNNSHQKGWHQNDDVKSSNDQSPPTVDGKDKEGTSSVEGTSWWVSLYGNSNDKKANTEEAKEELSPSANQHQEQDDVECTPPPSTSGSEDDNSDVSENEIATATSEEPSRGPSVQRSLTSSLGSEGTSLSNSASEENNLTDSSLPKPTNLTINTDMVTESNINNNNNDDDAPPPRKEKIETSTISSVVTTPRRAYTTPQASPSSARQSPNGLNTTPPQPSAEHYHKKLALVEQRRAVRARAIVARNAIGGGLGSGDHRETPENGKARKVRFRQRYPVPPLIAKPRMGSEIKKDNEIGESELVLHLAKPKKDLKELFDAARGPSLARRSNACGALKVLTTQKKNRLTLVRTAGFLDALQYAANQKISSVDSEVALDARTRAVVSLLNVSEPKDNRIIVLSHKGLAQCLLKCIIQDHGEARVAACGTLAMLAKTPACREQMVKVKRLVSVLATIVQGVPDGPNEEKHFSKDDDDDDDDDEDEEDDEEVEEEDDESLSGRSSAGSYSDGHSSRSSKSHVKEPVTPARKSIRTMEAEQKADCERRARLNACAALVHLSKHCAISWDLVRNNVLMDSLVAVSKEYENPIHTKCLEILCHLSRFPPNMPLMANYPGVVETLVMSGKAKLETDRVWSLRTLQNLSSDVEGKNVLANGVVLELLSMSVMRHTYDEQVAATATLYNLSTEPGAVVPLTNTRNVVATLVHVAHSQDSASDIRIMACDALATLGLWLQTLAGAGTVPEGIQAEPLPSYVSAGWERWD